MKQTLGNRIAEKRRARGLKQDELAEKLGISSQAISKWENDISCPDISLLPALAAELDCSLDELLTGEKKPVVQMQPAENRKKVDDMMLRITITADEEETVRINIPVPLIKVALETGIDAKTLMVNGSMQNTNIDFAGIMKLIDQGVIGTLMEIEAPDGVHICITVE
ncbi:MAG: helix-turn-helix domain-containing protein [Clostridia bacterium]|nr:helix-turn-helix domain-containing protein [Clostridia bacterium]